MALLYWDFFLPALRTTHHRSICFDVEELQLIFWLYSEFVGRLGGNGTANC